MDKKPIEYRVFIVFAYIFVVIIALLGVIPFIMLLSGSFTSESYIVNHGYSLIPKEFSVNAYKTIFENPQRMVNSYAVTIFITVVGTVISLFLTAMTAYVLQRKDFPWRNKISYFIYFTTLFSGGLTPWYMLMMKFGMKNNLAALIIPNLFSVFNILIVRNYLNGIPHEISESAKVDGANDFQQIWSVYMPLALPMMFTVGMVTFVGKWNSWLPSVLYLEATHTSLQLVQHVLKQMIDNMQAFYSSRASGSVANAPLTSARNAGIVIVILPLILISPILQKYFVNGITAGSEKG